LSYSKGTCRLRVPNLGQKSLETHWSLENGAKRKVFLLLPEQCLKEETGMRVEVFETVNQTAQVL